MMLKKIQVIFALFMAPLLSWASLTQPENGREYQLLTQPQATETTSKVEVLEFFFYSCPHCNLLDPIITAWAKKAAGSVVFKRVPVNFGPGQQVLQRMYYTLEAMGKLEGIHPLMFKAIHELRQIPRTEQDVLNFVAKYGVNKQQYVEVSQSFAVETQLRRAAALQAAYNIEVVPALFVGGKYATSPAQLIRAYPGMSEIEADQSLLKVLDGLVQKIKTERRK